jgi:hypothetical protein
MLWLPQRQDDRRKALPAACADVADKPVLVFPAVGAPPEDSDHNLQACPLPGRLRGHGPQDFL